MPESRNPRRVDELLRKALWEAHGRKCAYAGDIIERLSEMEVDHILPRELWNDSERLAKILKILGLSNDYHPDSLDNLLPTSQRRNRQKRNWVFQESNVRFYREIAAKHRNAVERWCAKIETTMFQERLRSEMQAVCAANPKMRAKLIEVLHVTTPFNTQDFVSESKVIFSRPRASIVCDLPSQRQDGSVLIRINTLYLHNVQFTIGVREFLSNLINGVGTPLNLGQRRFAIEPTDKQERDWIVTLNGTTIFLTSEELDQLCTLIDLVAPHFLAALLKREQEDQTLFFAPDGPRNVRLITVQRALWKAILEFAGDHDYSDGTSRWHIFDSGGHGHIKIVRRPCPQNVVPFEFYAYPAAPEEYGGMSKPQSSVSLCWDESQSQIENGLGRNEWIRGWTAQESLHWLTTELIPEVVRRCDDQTLVKQFQPSGYGSADFYQPTWGLSPALFTPLTCWSSLSKFCDAAQEIFHQAPHEGFPRAIADSTFRGIVLLEEALSAPPEMNNYISEKLAVDCGSIDQMLAEAESRLSNQVSFDGTDIDNLLRCAGAIFDDNDGDRRFPSNPPSQVVEAWKPLITTVRFQAVRQRTLERIEQLTAR